MKAVAQEIRIFLVCHWSTANLSATVREQYSVGTRGGVAITLLILIEVGAAVLVVDAVLEGVVSRLLGLLLVGGGLVVWSGLVVGRGRFMVGGRLVVS